MNRRNAIGIVAALGAGWALWHPLTSLTAQARHDKTKDHSVYLNDPHLIRQNDEARSLRQQVDAAKKKAFEHGYHACCISPPCSWCLLHLGQCSCAMGVGSGRYACRECHGGWEANQGRIPGRTKMDVRKMKTISADYTGGPSAPAPPETDGAPPQSGAGAKSGDADSQTIAAGEKAFISRNCRSCHSMNGQGGNGGPDLTHEGQRQPDVAWQVEHLKDPKKVRPGSMMPSYANLPPDELKALAAYLVSRK